MQLLRREGVELFQVTATQRTSACDSRLVAIASPTFLTFAQLFRSILVNAVAVLIAVTPVHCTLVDIWKKRHAPQKHLNPFIQPLNSVSSSCIASPAFALIQNPAIWHSTTCIAKFFQATKSLLIPVIDRPTYTLSISLVFTVRSATAGVAARRVDAIGPFRPAVIQSLSALIYV